METPDKKKYIGCLSILLIVWIVNSVFTVIYNIIVAIGGEGSPLITSLIIIINIFSIIGIVLLLKINRIGFYMFLFSMVAQLIIAILSPDQVESNAVLRSIVGVVLLLVLMCLKNKETKLNAFQTIGLMGKESNSETSNSPKDSTINNTNISKK